jgi:hypothetical protein
VAALIREAVRTVWLRPEPKGPVAIWSGPIGGTSIEHDSIYDEHEARQLGLRGHGRMDSAGA